jgi:hypothetical protein
MLRKATLGLAAAAAIFAACAGVAVAADNLSPLLAKDSSVNWWFTFKMNSAAFPSCAANAKQACIFGGAPQSEANYGQQYVYASSSNGELQQGEGCAGDTLEDPIGATFDQIYNGLYSYVVWNDQFYLDPAAPICPSSCGPKTAHSKGVLAWDDAGNGLVMQVSTPSWPGAGNKKSPRHKVKGGNGGNTLGCIQKPNNVLVSQHFFALKLNKSDVILVLKALANAGAVTDPDDLQVARIKGPADIQKLARALGEKTDSAKFTQEKLSSGVQIISKGPNLYVAPWQFVSALLDGEPLRAATWWNNTKIFSTAKSSKITCWDKSLPAPGPVQIALTGEWAGKKFELYGGVPHNHAKIGVGTSPESKFVILGDMNQEGAVLSSHDCTSSQNKRGGLFYVVEDEKLHDSVQALIKGDSAPVLGPKTK